MKSYEILSIKDRPEFICTAAEWFSGKWNVDISAYIQSMNEAVSSSDGVPDWFVIMDEGKIIAGLGVIENDFHERTDLAPNICAVYVEEDYRNRGIAGKILEHAVEKLTKSGISPVYLLTDHTSFYERYGWKFFTDVKETGGGYARLYIKR